MAIDHPFQMLFETLGRVPSAHAEAVNRRAYTLLSEILHIPVERAGRCILLRAPRAGHGKTHLLARIQHHLGGSHEFVSLHPALGCRIDAASVTDDTLRSLVRGLPASGGLCVLDLVTRRLFAAALQPLVGSGEVPCQDREGALAALRGRPIETFDFHHPNAVTAHWARENFEVLGQRLSLELSQRCGQPVREVSFWVEALFRFAATPVENPGRVRALAELIHAGPPGEGEATERLQALLGLLSLLMRVVLVADDVEGFSTDEGAALRFASFLASLRQSVERLDVILSLNQDIWESAFLPRLSGGLADRLSEVVVELEPLQEAEMVALLDSRVPGLGGRILEKIDRKDSGTHARGLIRAAGLAWMKATVSEEPAAVEGPFAVAPAVAPETESAVLEPAPEPEPAPVVEAEVTPAPAAPIAEVVKVAAPPSVAAALAKFYEDEPVAEVPANSDAPVAKVAEVTAAVVPAAPEPEPLAEVAAPAPVNSPFQIPVAVGRADASEAGILPPKVIPVVDSPFQIAAISELSAPVSGGSWYDPQPEESPAAPVAPAVPFYQMAPVQSEPPVFEQAPQAVQSAPPAFESSFQPASPVFEPTFQPTRPVSEPAPQLKIVEPEQVPVLVPVVDPGVAQSQNFSPALSGLGGAVVPAVQPAAAAAAAVAPSASDTDRVDELLRQFRERYGRSSL